jgi:hypothetical protein
MAEPEEAEVAVAQRGDRARAAGLDGRGGVGRGPGERRRELLVSVLGRRRAPPIDGESAWESNPPRNASAPHQRF